MKLLTNSVTLNIELAKNQKGSTLSIKKEIVKMEKEVRSNNELKSWDAHLTQKYGEVGTSARTELAVKAHTFVLAELLKDERAKAKMTQAQLAERTRTNKFIFLK